MVVIVRLTGVIPVVLVCDSWRTNSSAKALDIENDKVVSQQNLAVYEEGYFRIEAIRKEVNIYDAIPFVYYSVTKKCQIINLVALFKKSLVYASEKRHL